MAHPAYLREKALQLRRDKRLTIDELAERLALPRTTIYYWVRDLPVPRRTWTELPEKARMTGTRAMQKKYRLRRELAYREGRAVFTSLARDPTFRDFVCMYIGEGYKRNRNKVALANSDPKVMKLAARWMSKLAGNRIHLSLQYHADQDPERLKAFWRSTLGLEDSAFRYQRKSNSGNLASRNWRCRYGVLTVHADDTIFRARLQGWIDCVQEQWLDSMSGA
jgi:transposase-like protein